MAQELRFVGTVQGVGFRPTVAKIARELGLNGLVWNDGRGVTVQVDKGAQALLDTLMNQLPPLAKVREVTRSQVELSLAEGFSIAPSQNTAPRAGVAPDAGICAACRAEVRNPFEDRYRYPFASCTHCGPRYSVVASIPYDRVNTSLRDFPLCQGCQSQFDDESQRHYHAQTTACHRCGPQATLERGDGRAFAADCYSMMDEVDAVATLLLQGEIVAVKGLGGYHLCCDATNAEAVQRLRDRKARPHKPLAMMARDLEVIERYAHLDAQSRELLQSPQSPILLLPKREGALPALASQVAPDQRDLGFMLPMTPLHELIFIRLDRPIVCTSANRSGAPQIIDDEQARRELGGRGGKAPAIADWLLTHNRPILNRVDDSLVKVVAQQPRVLRRARGYAPDDFPLPRGLEGALPILALGADLKASVALGFEDRVVLSPHLGELDDLRAFEAWQDTLDRLTQLWRHRPSLIAVDDHSGYRSTQVGVGLSQARGLPLIRVQHHHAHLAAVMAEHGEPADAPDCLGIALDGLGMGEQGQLWGGELMALGYAKCERLATFKPVAMLGGDKASREPWRNLYAHLRSFASFPELLRDYGELAIFEQLQARPTALLDSMLQSETRAPVASSAGRLFDAVAAALGLCVEGQSYEAQAAMMLESMVTPAALSQAIAEADEQQVYPVGMPTLECGLPYFEWRGLWQALLGDLAAGTCKSLIAARFHVALAYALRMGASRIRRARHQTSPLRDTAVLGGGCFQNAVLLEQTQRMLQDDGWRVLSPCEVPANDGSIALGQAVVAAALAQQVKEA